MRKWVEKEYRYVPYSVPDDWYCLSEEDCTGCTGCMDVHKDGGTIINCASCGNSVSCRDCYPSLTIQIDTGYDYYTDSGCSYLVCHDCYHEEHHELFGTR